jgi:hypothetical protein
MAFYLTLVSMKKINLSLMVIEYLILISNINENHRLASTAHYLFMVFFFIIFILKFLEDKIGLYVLLLFLVIILGLRFYLN